jgi:hypothetical protein
MAKAFPNVHKLQRRFKLTPLSRWNNRHKSCAHDRRRKVKGITADPSAMVEKCQPARFANLSRLMGKQPALDDAVMKMLTGFRITRSTV